MTPRNIRLTLAYDGSDFSGWQVQPDRRTVQSVVEAAIADLTGVPTRILAAGRTDSGVHALGQTVNFRTTAAIPPERWAAALQSRLPRDVSILESCEVGSDFHATYSAISKRYRYILRTSPVEDPFLRRYAWRLNETLDASAMRTAAADLLGRHDFRCFESEWPNKATSVRTVLDIHLQRTSRWPAWLPHPLASGPLHHAAQARDATSSAEGELLIFEIAADGFLYNMVRAIVGTLVQIGRGRWPASQLARIVAAQDRALAGETAPPHGLYLVQVCY